MTVRSLRRCLAAGVVLGIVALLAACYLPNHFKSEIRLGATGDYALSYYGELIWAPLYREIRQGHLTRQQTTQKIGEIQRDLARDSNFKKIEPQPDGSFKVAYERQGRLQARENVVGCICR